MSNKIVTMIVVVVSLFALTSCDRTANKVGVALGIGLPDDKNKIVHQRFYQWYFDTDVKIVEEDAEKHKKGLEICLDVHWLLFEIVTTRGSKDRKTAVIVESKKLTEPKEVIVGGYFEFTIKDEGFRDIFFISKRFEKSCNKIPDNFLDKMVKSKKDWQINFYLHRVKNIVDLFGHDKYVLNRKGSSKSGTKLVRFTLEKSFIKKLVPGQIVD